MHPVTDEGRHLPSKDSRAIKFKTRTGCYTCKYGCSRSELSKVTRFYVLTACRARKVKCDETKPSCLRCVRFKTQCGGYPKPHMKSPRRPLLPKSSDAEMALQCPVSARLFESDQDLRYLRIFWRRDCLPDSRAILKGPLEAIDPPSKRGNSIYFAWDGSCCCAE